MDTPCCGFIFHVLSFLLLENCFFIIPRKTGFVYCFLSFSESESECFGSGRFIGIYLRNITVFGLLPVFPILLGRGGKRQGKKPGDHGCYQGYNGSKAREKEPLRRQKQQVKSEIEGNQRDSQPMHQEQERIWEPYFFRAPIRKDTVNSKIDRKGKNQKDVTLRYNFTGTNAISQKDTKSPK